MTQKAFKSAITRVPASASDTLILAANDARNGAVIFNEGTGILYLALRARIPASTVDYSVQVPANQPFFIDPDEYTGEVRGVWSATGGAAQVTEFV